MRMRRVVMALAVSVLVFCGSSFAQEAKDIAFTDPKGAAHSLAEFRGKVVLLDFWASWCAPCRKGFPFYNGLQARFEGAGLQVIGVSLDEDADAVDAFIAAIPAAFLVGRDPLGVAGEAFEVAVMPTSFLIDRDGRVVARFEGGTEPVHRNIETSVEQILSGRPPTDSATRAAREGPKGNLRAWQRGHLADPIMNLDGDVLSRVMRDHIFSSKEAAAGDGGVAGGGCGCN